MSYIASAPVVFSSSPAEVYTALIDLSLYPKWNTGMKSISRTDTMTIGMIYETVSDVGFGRINHSQVEVVRMVADKEIELVSYTGIITYRALFRLISDVPGTTEVICTLRFEFHDFVLDMARPAIEHMAKMRLKANLEILRSLLASH